MDDSKQTAIESGQPDDREPTPERQAELKDATPGDRWADPVTPERAAELKALADQQRAWAASPNHLGRESYFTGVRGARLTGADVFWLAAYALAGPEGNQTTAQYQLQPPFATATLQYKRGRFPASPANLSALHLEGASLDRAHLEGAGLGFAHLEQATLGQAHLERAYLEGAHLEGAYLGQAQLEEARLEGAQLEEARLEGAQLDGARLEGAHLEGATLTGARLEGAILEEAHLEGAKLEEAQLDGAYLGQAHLEGAVLRQAQLERATLTGARLEGAILEEAHLEGAKLEEAHLEGTVLGGAHLEGAVLRQAQLERADLRSAWLDSKTVLSGARLDNQTRLGDIQWSGVGAVNLTQLDWSRVPRLGDETALQRNATAEDYEAAVRAYRQVAAQLRAQGMSEVADRFLYRAQVVQRRMLRKRREVGRWFGTWLLDAVSGHGYKPMRSVFTYLLVVGAFAGIYFALGGAHGQSLSWNESLVVSLTAFHGRGFFATAFQPGDPQAAVAAVEAIIGLLIEITFIATFTQRFFAR